MAELFDTGIFSVEDTDGSVGAGWKLNFYVTGTSTRQNTYPTEADANAGTNANANPVVADAAGRFPAIWLATSTNNYKAVLTNASDVVKVTRDPAVTGFSALGGSSRIGFLQAGAGAVAITVQAKLRQAAVCVDEFGAVGDGVTNDSSAIAAAHTALLSLGGGELLFSHGKTYLINSSVTMVSGIAWKGTGSSGINMINTYPGAKIKIGASGSIVNSASTIHEVKFENLTFHSASGGGHIFDWSSAGVVAKIEFDGVTWVQENAAKYIIKGTAAGGVFSIWIHDCDYQYATGNTVNPFYFASPTVNSVVIERTWSTCTTAAASGVHSIHFESTNAGGPAINCIVRDVVFELPGGGSVKMLSCANSGVENCTVYDLTAGVVNNPQFEIGDGTSGPPSNNCWIKGCRSNAGTVAKPDCKIDTSVAAQGSFTVDGCTFSYLDGGGSTSAPAILIIGSDITNFQNIAYTRLGTTAEGDISFATTDGSSKSYKIWNGYSGNGPGILHIYQNGAWVGGVSSGGALYWGGTRTAPGFYVDSGGQVNAKKAIYPGTPALSDQLNAGLFAGSGAPSNANGNNGDFYFRSDGTAAGNTVIYHKEAGAWVALTT